MAIQTRLADLTELTDYTPTAELAARLAGASAPVRVPMSMFEPRRPAVDLRYGKWRTNAIVGTTKTANGRTGEVIELLFPAGETSNIAILKGDWTLKSAWITNADNMEGTEIAKRFSEEPGSDANTYYVMEGLSSGSVAWTVRVVVE